MRLMVIRNFLVVTQLFGRTIHLAATLHCLPQLWRHCFVTGWVSHLWMLSQHGHITALSAHSTEGLG